jgi:hypothetical protein
VGAQTNQTYCILVNPNQEEIASNMAFHATFVLASQHVWTAVGRLWVPHLPDNEEFQVALPTFSSVWRNV